MKMINNVVEFDKEREKERERELSENLARSQRRSSSFGLLVNFVDCT